MGLFDLTKRKTRNITELYQTVRLSRGSGLSNPQLTSSVFKLSEFLSNLSTFMTKCCVFVCQCCDLFSKCQVSVIERFIFSFQNILQTLNLIN